MYCIAMSKCGLWEHCVQVALYEAQPQAWHVTGSTFHALNQNNMPFGLFISLHLACVVDCINNCLTWLPRKYFLF